MTVPLSPRQRIDPDNLEGIFAAHAVWVSSGALELWLRKTATDAPAPDQGTRADLRRADLSDVDLRRRKLPGAMLNDADLARAQLDGADLAYASLRGAILSGASIAQATFFEANLDGADLRGVTDESPYGPSGADLTRSSLRNSDLRGANISHAKGLIQSAVAGADLTDAKLPDAVTKFDALSQVAETSKNGSIALAAMLAACGYSWLTIASTTDLRLITNRSTSPLPIAGTEIPIAGFYLVAPLILFGAFLYLHLYLLRLWQLLADLPAVFPDGATLDAKAYPWLMNALVRVRLVRLRAKTTCHEKL